MRDLTALKDFIMPGQYASSDEGVFCFYRPNGEDLRVIATAASVEGSEGWDHVSVSTASRCPVWDEMEHIKRLFFKDDETAMQLHVPPTRHVNCHPHCLHLWRPDGTPQKANALGTLVRFAIPMPNPSLVGGIGVAEPPKISAHKRAVLHAGDLDEMAKWFPGRGFDRATLEIALHKMRALIFQDFAGELSKEWLLSRGFNLEVGYMQEESAA